jgi:DNA polymerase-3 subunit chi
MPVDRVKVEYVNLRQARAGLEQAAARLAERHFSQGRKVLILAADPAQAELLDRALWNYDPNSFLPHARAGAPDQAREPVLIATDLANPNQATVLISAAPLGEMPCAAFSHLIQLLPLEEGEGLQACRACYKALNQAGQVELTHTTSI